MVWNEIDIVGVGRSEMSVSIGRLPDTNEHGWAADPLAPQTPWPILKALGVDAVGHTGR